MTSPATPSIGGQVDQSVIVVGAGFAGLGLGVQLLRAGVRQLTILEKADDIGGVWRENTYPGAACDLPSSLYSWSFAPNPDWGRRYARQADILSYIQREADRCGVRRHVRTGAEVASASWAGDAWDVVLVSGERLRADVLVSAVGQLSRPVIPDLPGTESFAGPAFHSAQWDHEAALAGKRIAVVGTGASAIQFVPAIVDEVASLTVFQRSAPYVVPKPDRAYTGIHHRSFRRLPASQHAGRQLTFHASELLNKALTEGTWLKSVLGAVWAGYLRATVRDRRKRHQLKPDYELGCKRLLFSNDWYPAIAKPHVAIETAEVSGLEPDGIRTSDGVLHPADVLIWGTGFAATEFLAPMSITGRGGVSLADVWSVGAHAYLGITVPGFPNFFVMYGPNTNLGGSSIIGMLEAQAGYIVQAISAAAVRGPLSVRPEVAAQFDVEVQGRLRDSVWAGCSSWYREANGRVSTNWPGMVVEYQRRTADFRDRDYVTGQPAPQLLATSD